jgi:hypothetical protein
VFGAWFKGMDAHLQEGRNSAMMSSEVVMVSNQIPVADQSFFTGQQVEQ